MRSEDALRRALTQAIRAEHSATTSARGTREKDEAYAIGVRVALQWALGFSNYDPWGGVGIHEMGADSFYPPASATETAP